MSNIFDILLPEGILNSSQRKRYHELSTGDLEAYGNDLQGEKKQHDQIVERFAETLAAKNKAYETLVRQAKEAAAESHAERLKIKEEVEKQRSHARELLVGRGISDKLQFKQIYTKISLLV